MKKIIYTVIVFLCFTNFLWAQDTFIAHAVTLDMPNLGMAIPLGKSNVAHADTSNWRNPQNIDQSVLRFDTNELTSEQKNEKLRLLGFFYNPAVVHFDKKEGKVILNTNRSLYRKNKILNSAALQFNFLFKFLGNKILPRILPCQIFHLP